MGGADKMEGLHWLLFSGRKGESQLFCVIHPITSMANIEVLWSCSMWPLCVYGRAQRDMFSCGCIAEISCISGVNQWIEPKCTKQIPYLELVNIDFTSAERTMKEGGASAISESVKSRASAAPNPPEEDIKRLFDKCLTSENTLVLFSVECQPYCDAFIQSAAHLPLALQSLYDPANLQLNYMELVEAGESLQGILDISPAQQRHLETIIRD